MNTKLFVSGAVLALLAMSMPATAYHIEGTQVPTLAGVIDDSHTWDSATNVFSPVDEPCNDPANQGTWNTVVNAVRAVDTVVSAIVDVLLSNPDNCFFAPPGLRENDNVFALTLCEADDYGFGFPQAIPVPGHGGLCSMSPGYDNSGTSCVFTATAGGRSNGNGPNYDSTVTGGGMPCEDANNIGTGATQDFYGVIATVARDYYTFNMDGFDFIGQVNGIGCDIDDANFTVDMQYAYTTDSGHVSGFVTAPGSGTYTVASNGNTPVGTLCITNTPAPMFHS